MSLRRIALALAVLIPLVAGVAAYIAFLLPVTRRPPPPPKRIDLTKPFELHVEGMPGLKLYLNPADNVITPIILATGSWEPHETAWFLRCVKPGDTIVDAGANVGYYTLIGSRLVGDRGKVYAFEPEPVTFELLRKNVELNGLTNVMLEQKALSDGKGTLKLFIAEQNKGDHRIYQPQGESRPSVEVEAVRLDEYFKDHKRGIDFIKIDTQGAEGRILGGMTGLFEGRSDGPTIFMEFWPFALKQMGTDAGPLLETLRSYQYTFYEIRNKFEERPEPIDAADLLAAHPVEDTESQTDLMLLRGGREPPTGRAPR
jgi:FkbM family methyltransferase